MSMTLPELYFRVRDNGAAVFRISTQNRDRRMEMEQIAIVNTNRGDFKPHNDQQLTPAEVTMIEQWIKDRQNLLAQREMEDVLRLIDQLQLTTQWAQSRASETELDRVTDQMLLAIHDLRSVLVRKKADSLSTN